MKLFLLITFIQLVTCYIDQDLHHERRAGGHHTSYEVSHHMGKMNIKANPEGADFDFSGGDLHVDLHPAHSDVFPIYNYFHSDYHDDHEEEEEEPHHFEPFIHHHGSGEGHHEMRHHMPLHGGGGEDEQGETRMHHHNHHHDHDHHHHMHHEHDEEEIAADHGHEHMPNLFPIGMHHPGMMHGEHGHHHAHSGSVHRTDFHPGHVSHGGHGGGHNGGDGGSHHGYGKNIVPSDQVDSTKLDIDKLVPKDDTPKKKQPLDFVSENVQLNGNINSPAILLEPDEGEVPTTSLANFSADSPSPKTSTSLNMNLVRQKEKTENGTARTFLRPVDFKGSIVDKYRKHWDEEEDAVNGDNDTDDEQDDNEQDDDEDDNDDDNVKQHHPHAHHIDRTHHHRRHHQHHRHHHHRHNVRLEDMPLKDEYLRGQHDGKKVYPGQVPVVSSNTNSSKSDKVEPVKEIIDPEYKINDKLSAQETQLALDMQSEKEEEKELTNMSEKHHRHHHHKHRHHHGRHSKRHNKHRHKHYSDDRDDKEEEIEQEEKEIEKETAKHFKKEDDDSDEEADDVINSSIQDKNEKHHGSDEDTDNEDKEDEESEKEDSDVEEDEDEEEGRKRKHGGRFKYAGSDDGMKGEERRQHKFHDQLAHKTMHNFHEIEKPHEGEEKFEKDDEEEIEINDQTGEGDKDEESVERKLDEAKARLPLRFGKEAERLRHYGDTKEWGSENDKEQADNEMSKHLEQNQDPKLEGSDHDFYQDRPNFNEDAEQHGGDHGNNNGGEWHEGGEHRGNEGREHHDNEGYHNNEHVEDHPPNAEWHHDGEPPVEIQHNGGDPGEEIVKNYQEEDERRGEDFAGDRRRLTEQKTLRTTDDSMSQKDIYASLKKEEMGKTLGSIGEESIFENLKGEIKDTAEKPTTNIENKGNIYNQLKTELKQEEKTSKFESESNKLDKSDDILQSPENTKQVDNKLLKDFKQRFTEENGFQSLQSADEMLNELQELASNNQQQIDAHQMKGDFYKAAISNKRQQLAIASSSKRQFITKIKKLSKWKQNRKPISYDVKKQTPFKLVKNIKKKIRKKIWRKYSSRKNGRKLKTQKHKVKTMFYGKGSREITVKYFTTPKVNKPT